MYETFCLWRGPPRSVDPGVRLQCNNNNGEWGPPPPFWWGRGVETVQKASLRNDVCQLVNKGRRSPGGGGHREEGGRMGQLINKKSTRRGRFGTSDRGDFWT